MALQLEAHSPALDDAAVVAMEDSDWSIRGSALAIINARSLASPSLLQQVVEIAKEPVPDGMLFGPQEGCLVEAARFLARSGESSPEAVVGLIALYRKPYEPKMGYRLREAVLRAFARVGPRAASALPLLRVDDDYEPWLGTDAVALFAYWMVDGRYGDRCSTLLQMARLKDWHYRDFSVEELGQEAPCPEAIGVLKRAMQDEVQWVRIDAAKGLIRLGDPSSVSYELLKKIAAEDFDAFWQVMQFAKERGLDPAPLEAMIPAFRAPDSRVPSVTVDSVERELAEYRKKRPADQPFEPW